MVSSEVKSLAQQTARATDGVTEQVRQLRQATEAAMSALNGIRAGVDNINKRSVVIAAAVDRERSGPDRPKR